VVAEPFAMPEMREAMEKWDARLIAILKHSEPKEKQAA
jgi:hypothetical protein